MDETNPAYENFRNKMEAFGQPIKGTTRRVSASKFLGRNDLEKRVQINARKITILKNVIQSQQIQTGLMLTSLVDGSVQNVEKTLLDIRLTVVSILETLRAQEKFEYEKFLDMQRRNENMRRRKRESLLETSSRGMKIISKGVQKVLSPVTSIFSRILDGFISLIGGKILQQLVGFLTDPKISRFIIGFLSFVERFLPLITTGIGLGAIGLVALLARMGAITPIIVGAARLLIGIPTLGLIGDPLRRTSMGRLGTFRQAPLGKKAGRLFTNPGVFQRAARRIRFNTGGLVPGFGNTDSVPAMLTPGEVVISKPAVEKYGAINLLNLNKAVGSSNKPKIKRGISYANEGMQVPVPNIGELFGAVLGSLQGMENSDLGKSLSDPNIPKTLETFAEAVAIPKKQQVRMASGITNTVTNKITQNLGQSDFVQKIISNDNKPNVVPNLLPFKTLSSGGSGGLDMSTIFESVLNKVNPQNNSDQNNDIFNIKLNAPNASKLETLGLIP